MLQLKKTSSIIMMALIASTAIAGVFLAFEQPQATLAQTSVEDLCGQTITQSIDLTADLTCSEDGLKVQGSNIIIKLNGFAIRGPGDDPNTTGIFVDGGHEVRIMGPGMIEFFGTGIKYSDAVGGTIRDVQVGNSDVGLLADSSEEMQWKLLYVHDNRVGAIDDGSHNSEVEGVVMSSNDVGVHVMGNSSGIDINFNIIMDGKTGVQVDPSVTSANVFYNTMFRQEGLDMQLPTPLEGVLLGNNDCTASDPTQYCEGRVLPSGQRLTTNECGAGQAVDSACVEGLNLPSGGSGESEERGLGTQAHLTPEAQQAADAAWQRVMNGTQQNQTQSNDNSMSTSADSWSSENNEDNNNNDNSRSEDNNGESQCEQLIRVVRSKSWGLASYHTLKYGIDIYKVMLLDLEDLIAMIAGLNFLTIPSRMKTWRVTISFFTIKWFASHRKDTQCSTTFDRLEKDIGDGSLIKNLGSGQYLINANIEVANDAKMTISHPVTWLKITNWHAYHA
jgi:Periplasmic copper-binding protein (NosD)